MSIFRKFFGIQPAKRLRDVQSMSIDEVWTEFCESVTLPGGPRLIEALQSPEYAKALRWLQPPTNGAMAKGTLRAFVDLQRSGNWRELDNLVLVYEGDKEENVRPPQDSLDAIANLCLLLEIPATVYYRKGTSQSAEYAKIVITLDG